MALVDRHRRQRVAVGHVADRVDRRHRGLRPVVDRDRAVRPDADADLLEPEAFGVRVAAGGEEHLVDVMRLAIVDGDPEAGVGALDPRHVALDLEHDAAGAHRVGQVVAQVGVEAAQDLVAAVELDDLGAEPVHDAGELAGDVAAADDRHALGLLLEPEHLVRGDAELGAGDVRHEGPGAGRDEQMLGRVLGPVGEPHPVRVEHARAHPAELHAGAAQPVVVDRLQPRDLGVLRGDQPAPVERRRADGPAVARGVLEVVGEARRIDEELLRDAAADHAGAAVAVLLGQADPRPGLGRYSRRAYAARAAADHEQVEVETGHRRLTRPGCASARRCRAGRRRGRPGARSPRRCRRHGRGSRSWPCR